MTAPNDHPQRSTPSAEPEDPEAPRLVLTSAGPHPPACGERVSCPFGGDHGLAPYRPAERQNRPGGTVVSCHVCGCAWREVGA